MDKEDVVCIYNGTLFNHEKVFLPVEITWMDQEGIMSSEISQRNTKISWYHLYMEPVK